MHRPHSERWVGERLWAHVVYEQDSPWFAALRSHCVPPKPFQATTKSGSRLSGTAFGRQFMILDPASATRFIEGYKRILLQIEQRDGDKDKLSLIQRLVRARAKVLEAPSLIAAALVALDARQQSVDPELGGAICLARAQRAERVQ